MSKLLEIRNPRDLVNTYDSISIEAGAVSDGSDMAVIATPSIDTSTASDLSTGYTSYTHAAGTDATYYRYRYKVGSTYSSYSDIYLANTTIMHSRFRKKMKDTNSASYYFSNAEIDEFLVGAIGRLFPATYNEVIDESLTTVTDQEKYSFPIGVQRINEIELFNSAGELFSRPRNYKKRARQILFDNGLPSGYTIRLYCDKMFQTLAEIPEFLDDLVLDFMRLQAWETFEADRSAYYKYTTIIDPEGGNLPSIGSIIDRLQKSTERRLNAVRRVRRASEIKLI